MDHVFLDSSALVKYYAAEPGRQAVVALIQTTPPGNLHVGLVTGAEVVAALRRKEQTGAASPDEVKRIVAEFRADWWGSWTIIDVNRGIIDLAMELADRRHLRGYDAIQLACALTVGSYAAQGDDTLTVWSSDTDLLLAADAEGLKTLNPAQAPTP